MMMTPSIAEIRILPILQNGDSVLKRRLRKMLLDLRHLYFEQQIL
jgi:hypothetical protein